MVLELSRLDRFMDRIKLTWLLLLGVTSIFYVLSLNPIELTPAPWALRKSLLYYTGIVAITMMSAGLILTMRLQWLERWLGGLDKHYRLHKWLGVTGVVAAGVHWLVKLEPKWLVAHGWVAKDTFTTPPGSVGFFDRPDPFVAVRAVAKDAGEWAIYGLLLLAVLALAKRLPYRTFFKTHRAMAALYLVLVGHAVVMFSKLGWNHPIGYWMGLLMGVGSVAATLSLAGRTGARHRVKAQVVRLVNHAREGIMEVRLELQSGWPGHTPGQFAFVTFDAHEGAHPFSLSSAWGADHEVSVHIKQLGDYTRALPDQLQVGQSATVEGPYGQFDFKPPLAPQIWVGGGVGITPFLAKLDALRTTRAQTSIHFYVCVRHPDSELLDQVHQWGQQAGVQVTVVSSDRGQRLTGMQIRQENPDWQASHVWFCGPAELGSDLRDDLTGHGMARQQFHQELFELR